MHVPDHFNLPPGCRPEDIDAQYERDRWDVLDILEDGKYTEKLVDDSIEHFVGNNQMELFEFLNQLGKFHEVVAAVKAKDFERASNIATRIDGMSCIWHMNQSWLSHLEDAVDDINNDRAEEEPDDHNPYEIDCDKDR